MDRPALATAAPATTSSPARSRTCLAVGILLVAAGVGLAVWFMQDPLGAIPGFPTYWRGVPAVLGIGFFMCVGGFLVLQRRFSLAAFLTGAIVSGVVTAGLQAYVHSFRETKSHHLPLKLDEVSVRDLDAACRQAITTDRLAQFVLDAKRATKTTINLDFDEVQVFVAPDRGEHKDGVLWAEMELHYRHSTFLHKDDGQGRWIVTYYAYFLAEWTRERLTGNKLDFAATAGEVDVLISSRGGYRHEAWRTLSEKLVALTWRINLQDNAYSGNAQELEFSKLHWLADREPDPELKAFLANVAESLRVRWKLPKPAGGTKK